MQSRFTKSVFSHAAFQLKALFGIKSTCTFGAYSIVLPSFHLLPKYQREHRLYDRFLPHLASHLPPNSTVIDVGANCGDTLAGMLAANPSLSMVCIEPDDVFFEYLTRNVARIQAVTPTAAIKTVKALVGKSIAQAQLHGSRGTAKAVVGNGEKSKKSQTLDSIANDCGLTGVSLVKSDVDGFDYDVIDSAEQVLRKYQPILFFECFFDNDEQRASLKRTLRMLESTGYSNWVVFDNFGELVLRTEQIEHVDQLLDYCWRQNIGRSTRTIYYFDLLVSTPSRNEWVDKVLTSYVELKLDSNSA